MVAQKTVSMAFSFCRYWIFLKGLGEKIWSFSSIGNLFRFLKYYMRGFWEEICKMFHRGFLNSQKVSNRIFIMRILLSPLLSHPILLVMVRQFSKQSSNLSLLIWKLGWSEKCLFKTLKVYMVCFGYSENFRVLGPIKSPCRLLKVTSKYQETF